MNLSNNPITKLSLTFIRSHRITLLISFALVILGIVSYTTLLKREGFPQVEIPTVVVQTNYFINDAAKIDSSVTKSVEAAIRDIPELETVYSTTTANTSTIRAQFQHGFATKEAVSLVRDEIQQDVTLPEGATLLYQTFNASAVDGTHDLIFTLSADQSTKTVQEKAQTVATKLEKLSVVQEAASLDLITTETNPLTNAQFEYQSGFNRVSVRRDGELAFRDAVGVGVIKKGETGTLELSEAIRAELDSLKEEGLLDGYEVTYSADLADALEKQIGSLEENAVSAVIIIMIVLALLINWRAAFVLAIFLPLTLGAVFLALYMIGYSLNTISLFGLILVLGLFVDDGTIVVEAIDYYKRQGKKGLAAVAAAVDDIGVADISGTTTTLLVFVPMLFISGILGDFIQLIPVTVILALALSLLIALTIIPYLTNIIIPDETEKKRQTTPLGIIAHRIGTIMPTLISTVARTLASFVEWYTKKRWTTALIILASIGFVVLGASYASKLTFSVFPSAKDTDALTAQITYPDRYTISQAQTDAQKVEEAIKNTIGDEVDRVTYYFANSSSAFISIDLVPMGDREPTSKELLEKLNDTNLNLTGTTVKFDQVSAGPTAADYPFALQVHSEDQAVLERSTAALKSYLADREIGDGEKIVDVRIDNLAVIAKRDGQRYAEVRAKISDPTNTGLVLDIQNLVKNEFTDEKLRDLGLSTDALGFDLGQESKNLESFQSAIVAFGVALLVMYGLLVLQFNSFSQPFLVFLAIPFSFLGLFPGLYATDNALSFFVMVGIIALAGIVVNNSIILLEYANHARREGKSAKEAIAQAIRIRFRPMLTTSVTTIGGLLPLAFTDPFWESLAFTIIFGLISSLLLVLLAFPAYYVALEGLRSYRPKWLARRLAQ